MKNMLLVQEFLETKTFKELQELHGVYASFSKSGHKFSLNYDMIEAKETDPLSQECRGLILAAKDGKSFLSQTIEINGKKSYDHISPGPTTVIAYPIKRFFNFGQGSAANVNWSDPKLTVLEKMDGTLCIVYYDLFTCQWCVATRSVPEADLTMDSGLFTFRTLFEKALFDTCGKTFEEYTDKLVKDITYCFELTTPYNRIVVNYPNNRVTLIAARANAYVVEAGYNGTSNEETHCCSEYDIEILPSYGVSKVKSYKFTTVNDLVDWVSTLNPMENEGVVVKDSNFNRIKVKNANYVAYSKARDVLGTSQRNCLELILQEKEDDVIPFLPEEIANNLIKIKSGLVKFIKHYDIVYQEALAEANAILPGDKKTFALLITKNKELWTAPLFQIFANKAINMKDFIQKNRKEGTWSDGFLDHLLDLSKKMQ